jgi:ABC-type lipoprotein release transport system permease subunit
MPAGNLARMVAANTWRSPRHFALSAFGIVIGIATFVLFLASTEQVAAVLEKAFPVEQVKVVAPQTSLLGKDVSKKLDDSIVQTIQQRHEVKQALPRMALSFPAFGRGDFEGNDLRFEVGGFADGIAASFVDDDERIRTLFKDWDADKTDKYRVACAPPPHAADEVIQSPGLPPQRNQSVETDWAGNPIQGSAAPDPAPAPVDPTKPKPYYNPCPNPDEYYCDEADNACHHRVPVVMSPTMIELYNSQFAKSHGLPIADTDFVKFITQRGGLSAMRFSIGLGLTTIAGTNTAIQHPPRRVEAVLVGISDKAMPIGMTVPIDYIRRWNREFLGEEAATSYSSIVVTLADRNDQAVLDTWVEEDLHLSIEDSLGKRFATVIFVIRVVLLVISFVIIGISAINIGHNFFMQVTERRRELGLLRAVGATRSDVRMVVLGEAALIGVLGGLLGILLGFTLAAGVDYASTHYLPRFPYKPDSWFVFRWWILAMGLAFAAGFAVLGGYLPARRASNMEPAQALTQN